MEIKGYELQRLVSKLRIIGMREDADKLDKDHQVNYLSQEAIEVILREQR